MFVINSIRYILNETRVLALVFISVRFSLLKLFTHDKITMGTVVIALFDILARVHPCEDLTL